MKRKLIFVLSTFVVLGLAIAVLALNKTSGTSASAVCCKGDSCPMKGKHAEKTDASSGHENCACKDGDEACPMMKDGAMSGHQMKMNGMSADHQKMMDGKESCPMMKDGAMKGHPNGSDPATPSSGKGGCGRCSKQKQAKTAPAI